MLAFRVTDQRSRLTSAARSSTLMTFSRCRISPQFNQCAGTFGNNSGLCGRGQPRPEELYNTRVTWSSGPLTLSMLWRYISEVEVNTIKNNGADPVADVDAIPPMLRTM